MIFKEFDPSLDLRNCNKVIILGGGCYGSVFSQRISRAKEKNQCDYSYQLIVDINSECEAIVNNERKDVLFFNGDWMDFFSSYVGYFINEQDYVVLPCNTPHFIFNFFVRMLTSSKGHRVEVLRLNDNIGFPYEEYSGDSLYISNAEWTCPYLCREPEICPAIHEARLWNIRERLCDYLSRIKEYKIDDSLLFESDLVINGVALIATKKIISGYRRLISTAEILPKVYVIATISQCHGAISVFKLK
ncbi:MAG: hypothetical protein A2Y62_01395 [Candidatus Fischerbacteria bacterium RBG_13_37_8]|uniref:Uncharacterized protein n=1 Tax=Candidatus Fischerbacteria bacterium RBG_13_37_8 TaxID=1817863 RepID=A0A1F5VU15_9BACT|nr:MAG: hypothetical protein A2Y62_01395 [Candidatus Fischerbacteria bacterium RBG_13_37_8]